MKSIKKTFCLIFVSVSMMLLANTAMAEKNITVFVDNSRVEFDVQPKLIGGRTMVPLRAIFEALGATVTWDESTQTVTAYNEAYLVKSTIGKNEMLVNNEKVDIDIPPMIVDGRTLVPARFVAEAFNCDVKWDSSNFMVNITSKSINYADLEKSTSTSDIINSSSTSVSTSTVSADEGTLMNPYAPNQGAPIIYQEWSHYPQKIVEITCTNIIRGETANRLAHSENMFNEKPNSNQEWCFLEFNVKYISSLDGSENILEGNDVIYEDTFFTSTGSLLNVADMATLGDTYKGYGVFDTEFYPGASGKVVIGLLINKNAGDILLRVPNKSQGTNSWILCK